MLVVKNKLEKKLKRLLKKSLQKVKKALLRKRQPKSLLEKPGTPTIQLPSNDISAILSELDIPITFPSPRGGFFSMRVPASCGEKVFFT